MVWEGGRERVSEPINLTKASSLTDRIKGVGKVGANLLTVLSPVILPVGVVYAAYESQPGEGSCAATKGSSTVERASFILSR